MIIAITWFVFSILRVRGAHASYIIVSISYFSIHLEVYFLGWVIVFSCCLPLFDIHLFCDLLTALFIFIALFNGWIVRILILNSCLGIRVRLDI